MVAGGERDSRAAPTAGSCSSTARCPVSGCGSRSRPSTRATSPRGSSRCSNRRPSALLAPCPELARGCGACPWQHVELGAQRSLKQGIVLDAVRRIGKLDLAATEPTRRAAAVVVPHDRARRGDRRPRRLSPRPLARNRSRSTVASSRIRCSFRSSPTRRYPGADEVLLRCGSRTGERLALPIPGDSVRRPFPTTCAPTTSTRRRPGTAGGSRPVRSSRAGPTASTRWRVSWRPRPTSAATPTTALDLYSGVGIFAGVLAGRGWSVTAVESSSSAVADARVNLGAFRRSVVGADVTKWSPPQGRSRRRRSEPTRGSGRRGVRSGDAQRRPAARARQLRRREPRARPRVCCATRATATSLTPVDLFPHTFHVEVVTVFDR